mgnify:CR=1 FL=1
MPVKWSERTAIGLFSFDQRNSHRRFKWHSIAFHASRDPTVLVGPYRAVRCGRGCVCPQPGTQTAVPWKDDKVTHVLSRSLRCSTDPFHCIDPTSVIECGRRWTSARSASADAMSERRKSPESHGARTLRARKGSVGRLRGCCGAQPKAKVKGRRRSTPTSALGSKRRFFAVCDIEIARITD